MTKTERRTERRTEREESLHLQDQGVGSEREKEIEREHALPVSRMGESRDASEGVSGWMGRCIGRSRGT